MEWEIALSQQANKFLRKNHLPDGFVVVRVMKAMKRIFHEPGIAGDVKKLSGKWSGYYRVRSGNVRIIFSFSAHQRKIFVEVVDYRGNAYR